MEAIKSPRVRFLAAVGLNNDFIFCEVFIANEGGNLVLSSKGRLWGLNPIVAAQLHDSLEAMQPVCSTDYLAIFPAGARVRHLGPSQRSVTEPSFKLTKPAIPRTVSDEVFHQRMAADFSLLASVVTTLIFVVGVIPHLSR